MKLSEVKELLHNLNDVKFKLESGEMVPEHFHVTEIGILNKKFIDCGGVIRNEKVVNFQLWNADDVDHRLKPQKLLKIIELSEDKLSIEDLEIEVEYQRETISKYGLDFDGNCFILTGKKTACLAEDACGVGASEEKIKINLSDLTSKSSCTPGSGCC